MTSTTVNAQSSIAACAGIENPEERLACYDRVTENANQLPVVRLPRATTPAPQEQASEPEPVSVPAGSQDGFGLEPGQESQPEREPESRTYTVVAARHNDFTGWTIEFQGGGTWKQVGTEDYRIRVGEQYTIERAAMNSYFLANSRNNRKIRITRAQ